ncbi:alpha-amylase family glycosyl hydrolase [Sorangium sp. So ce1128]
MLDARWWQRGIVYQIYPRSFMDSNGDGIGDLRGIRSRLDYLAWLGVDAIWISPIYTSPMADFGYDVSDYCGIDPRFGTLDEFDALVRDAHGAGLRVILDFVPNHTSDRHPWFLESRASRASAKRGWYIWRDPAPDGGPPTNWLSEFGGPAWEWDAATGQYYYHAYLKEQPDLDWRNPEVRAAMLEVLRFWLDRGVDGFRVDTIHHLIKDSELRDNPPNPHWKPGMPPHRKLLRLYTTDRPEVHEAVAAMRRVLDAYDDRVLIGEAYLPFDRLMAYYGQDLSGMHLPFNFHLIGAPWNARAIAEVVREYEAALPPGAWPNWVLGNHDKPRIRSRIGAAQARVAAMLLLTLRGTPTLYYGDEIGMSDVPIAPDQVQDPFEKNVPGLGVGRDPERTPMQWDGGANSGFTTGAPWLPLAPDAGRTNVEALRADPRSILSLYRALIALRRAEPALAIGSYAPVAAGDDLLAYERAHGGRRLVVVLNLSSHPRRLELPGGVAGGRILLATGLDRAGERLEAIAELDPDEGLIAEVAGAQA